MGQYYKYINIDKRIIVSANHGLKLTEHSWLGNNEVVIPIEQLVKTEWQGDRVIQLGDYAERMAASTKLKEKHLKFVEIIKKRLERRVCTMAMWLEQERNSKNTL
jgi:hypothetical protein